MINITDKHNCCGCGACVQKCPKTCISLQEDNEGFLYPQVDTVTCIDCGLCEKVCPILNTFEKRKPAGAIAAINHDEEIRKNSSSGGIFTMLAEKVINEGGVVFGARFNKEWEVCLDYTDSIEGLAAFRGSKYVQAKVGDIYKQCEIFLKEGRKVLFSGTPCQISGLHHYLRKEYDNLLTIDFACHGVPSPKVWKNYVKSLQKAMSLEQVNMRNKSAGWREFNFQIKYSSDSKCYELTSPIYDNDYMKAFLCDLILRPSCHDCKVKGFSSNSDITIADYWGIWNIAPEMNDDKGTSLVFIHNERGQSYFPQDGLVCKTTDSIQAIAYNSAIIKSSAPHKNREAFFAELDNEDIVQLIRRHTKLPFKSRVKKFVKTTLNTLIGGVNSEDKNKSTHELPNQPFTIDNIIFRDKQYKWQKYNITIRIR